MQLHKTQTVKFFLLKSYLVVDVRFAVVVRGSVFIRGGSGAERFTLDTASACDAAALELYVLTTDEHSLAGIRTSPLRTPPDDNALEDARCFSFICFVGILKISYKHFDEYYITQFERLLGTFLVRC